jgi:hypothetical protein
MYFLLAVCVSAALVLSAPFIGQIRNEIRARFPGQFVLILGTIVGVSVVSALILALVRIRDRRGVRHAAIASAVVLGVVYSVWTAKPDPQVNAVERFHFVEYGLITLLFYKAWRPLEDAGVLLLPLLAALTVAIVEEWFQWFIPGRVGALEDVLLNWAAISCGLLFSIGLDPPPRLQSRIGPRSAPQLAVVAATTTIVFGMFFDSVHLGYEVKDPAAGAFTSIFTGPELQAQARDRAARWRVEPPIDRTRLAREDQYRTEGIQHVRRRNEAWAEGDVDAAWRENLILETYYAPVLDTGHRWPAEQRADAAHRADGARNDNAATGTYVSHAYPYKIYTWPASIFWAGILILASAFIIGGVFGARSR